MSRGLVLVIEDDEQALCLLEAAIRDEGYDVLVCRTAQMGLITAVAQKPDCIVCDTELPDNDGFWVARNVRTHPSRVSVTPFLFLSGVDDIESRLEGFHVGADVYISKPMRVDEAVAQIEALVQMAARLRQRRDSMLTVPPSGQQPSAIEGDLEQMSIATVLTLLEMERRSGIFEVVSKKRRAQLELAEGQVVEGTVGSTRVAALAVLRTMLAWGVGRFSFVSRAPSAPPPDAGNKSLGAFLIEAMRLEDEAARADTQRRPSTEPKIAAPALGGPPSSPADFAPPSTRTPRPSDMSRMLDPELSDWEIPERSPPVTVARAAHAPPPPISETILPPRPRSAPSPNGRGALLPPLPTRPKR